MSTRNPTVQTESCLEAETFSGSQHCFHSSGTFHCQYQTCMRGLVNSKPLKIWPGVMKRLVHKIPFNTPDGHLPANGFGSRKCLDMQNILILPANNPRVAASLFCGLCVCTKELSFAAQARCLAHEPGPIPDSTISICLRSSLLTRLKPADRSIDPTKTHSHNCTAVCLMG